MPVKIPVIQRTQALAPQRIEGIKAQAPDAARSVAQTSQALAQAGKAVIGAYEREQKAAINSLKHEAVKNYNQIQNGILEGTPGDPSRGVESSRGIRHLDGDPTKSFSGFFNQLESTRKDILDKLEVSDRGKTIIERALINSENNHRSRASVYFGQLRDRYDTNTTNAFVHSEKENADENAMFIKAGDKSTLIPFDSSLGEIRKARIEHGLNQGSVVEVTEGQKIPKGETVYTYQDDEGVVRKVLVNASVRKRITADISESVRNGLNILLSANQVDEAKMMLEHYKDTNQIDSVHLAAINTKLEKKDVENAAFEKLSELDDLPIGEQIKKIKGIKTRNAKQAKIKQEALRLVDANNRFRENSRKRDSKEVFDQLAVQLMDKVDPDKAGANVIDNTLMLENSNFEVNGKQVKFEDIIDRVTDSKQKKALLAMVKERPKTGDTESFVELLDSARTGSMFGMTAGEFQQRSGKLSKSQYNKAFSLWRYTNVESDGQERSRASSLDNAIERIMVSKGMLRSGPGGYISPHKKKLAEVISTGRTLFTNKMMKGDKAFDVEQTANDIVDRFKRIEEAKDNDSGFFSAIADNFKGFTGLFNGEADTELAKPEDSTKFVPSNPFYELDRGAQKKFKDRYKEEKGITGSIPIKDFEQWFLKQTR